MPVSTVGGLDPQDARQGTFRKRPPGACSTHRALDGRVGGAVFRNERPTPAAGPVVPRQTSSLRTEVRPRTALSQLSPARRRPRQTSQDRPRTDTDVGCAPSASGGFLQLVLKTPQWLILRVSRNPASHRLSLRWPLAHSLPLARHASSRTTGPRLLAARSGIRICPDGRYDRRTCLGRNGRRPSRCHRRSSQRRDGDHACHRRYG